MKKIITISLVALVLAACANSKDAKKTTEPTAPVAGSTSLSDGTPKLVPVSDEVLPGGLTEKPTSPVQPVIEADAIEWLDFETAIDRNEKEPKYILVDVYTQWCGWCKKMDASTFKDPEVAKFISEYCYAVKMDAEMRTAIAYKGKLYEYQKVNDRSGYNSLAISLLDSKMSFPSFVILDKKEAKRGKIMGYKTPQPFLNELKKYVKH